MTIDGINISTFGLMLSNQEGCFDLPSRKKILSESGFESKDIKFESHEVKLTLIGKYVSLALILSNIEAFKTLIKSALEHNYVLIGHDISFTGAITEGIKFDVIKTLVKVTFTVILTES